MAESGLVVVLTLEEYREIIGLLERIERYQEEGRDLALDVRMIRMRLERKATEKGVSRGTTERQK